MYLDPKLINTAPALNFDRLAPFIQSKVMNEKQTSQGEGASDETAEPVYEFSLRFVVPNINCAGCMRKIESNFSKHPDLSSCRVNLSLKQVLFEWAGTSEVSPITGQSLSDELASLGFEARPLMEMAEGDDQALELRSLLWCLAVAGFATANVMLLSVSVWSGAEGSTRDLFHWLSALIALPTVAFAGRPFYRSAWQVLKVGRVNMDVPISLAVILAAALSLFETINHGEHAFYDAAVSLLFFLLIGRTLDRMMRMRAFHGVQQLLALKTETALHINDNGDAKAIAVSDVDVGMKIMVRPGETVPVDGKVVDGISDVDWSMVTGESMPQTAKLGSLLYAGLVNLTGPLTIETNAVGGQTLLSEIVRTMEAAQSNAPRYRKLADRAAALYAPVVHLAAAFTFVGWMIYGVSWQAALYTAISVLIITCPCALGLAVPVVQVVASSIAQRRGILMKDGAALEKLDEIDTIVFDKTGTLTLAKPLMVSSKFEINDAGITEDVLLTGAMALASHSLHPLSQALALTQSSALGKHSNPLNISVKEFGNVQEHPGSGLEAEWRGGILRLGSADWCSVKDTEATFDTKATVSDLSIWVSFTDDTGKVANAHFKFEDQLRPGALEVISFFKAQGMKLIMLSGDRSVAVERLAKTLGIDSWYGEMKPIDKSQLVAEFENAGHSVLMVGDGINDGPSLKAASVSLSPSKASDVAQVSASFVLMQEDFKPLIDIYRLSKYSRALIWQNFALAFIYNLIAIPIAVLGGVTPIIAALAMSGSSLVVMTNALRLHYLSRDQNEQPLDDNATSDHNLTVRQASI